MYLHLYLIIVCKPQEAQSRSVLPTPSLSPRAQNIDSGYWLNEWINPEIALLNISTN